MLAGARRCDGGGVGTADDGAGDDVRAGTDQRLVAYVVADAGRSATTLRRT